MSDGRVTRCSEQFGLSACEGKGRALAPMVGGPLPVKPAFEVQVLKGDTPEVCGWYLSLKIMGR